MTVIPPSRFERLRTTPLRDLVRGRVSGKLAWRRHIEICGLPDELKGVVLEVTRRTGLWRSEKVEVAQELIAHFYDGLDAGVSAEELIKRFGDLRTAAKLIKRAKKRGRPWPWHVWRRMVQVLAVLFVVWVGMAVWYALERPVASVDYAARLNAGVDAAAAQELAWPLYKQAWAKDEMFEDSGLQQKIVVKMQTPGVPAANADPGEPGSPEAHAYVTQRKEVIDLLRAAGQKKLLGLRVNQRLELETWRLNPSPEQSKRAEQATTLTASLGGRIWFTNSMRKSVRLLAADMLDAAKAGDGARAAADYQAMVGMALHTHDGDMMMGMVSQANNAMAMLCLNHTLARYPDLFGRVELMALAEATRRGRAACKLDYAFEKTVKMNLIQHVYSDDGHGDGNFTFSGYLWWKRDLGFLMASSYGKDEYLMLALLPGVVTWQYSRKEVVDYLNACFDEWQRRNNLPLWDCNTPAPGGVRNENFQEAYLRKQSGMATWRSPWIWRSLPMEAVYKPTSQTCEAWADALLTVLALEIYQRDHGAYPGSLAALAPDYLKEAPVDHSTGKTLLMRIENGRPLLYGRGFDGVDNGGKVNAGKEDGLMELQPIGSVKDGEDWVLFEPRAQTQR